MRYFLFMMLFSFSAQGAFRLYKLKVTYRDPQLKRDVTKNVTTTLDHLQYEHYHSGYGRMKVELLDTWYCPGDTARKKLCKKPKERKPPPRDIASAYDKEKRAPLDYNRQPIIP